MESVENQETFVELHQKTKKNIAKKQDYIVAQLKELFNSIYNSLEAEEDIWNDELERMRKQIIQKNLQTHLRLDIAPWLSKNKSNFVINSNFLWFEKEGIETYSEDLCRLVEKNWSNQNNQCFIFVLILCGYNSWPFERKLTKGRLKDALLYFGTDYNRLKFYIRV